MKACKRRIFSKLNFLKDRTQSVVHRMPGALHRYTRQNYIMRKTRKISRSFCTFIYTDCALAGIEVFSPKDSVTTNFFSLFKKRLPTSTLNLILLDMVQELLQLPLHTGQLLISTPKNLKSVLLLIEAYASHNPYNIYILNIMNSN